MHVLAHSALLIARERQGTCVIWHACLIARHACHLAHHPRQRRTKATVKFIVLLIKYAHIRDIMTRLACRVMARVPVRSPFYPKSRGGSQICALLKDLQWKSVVEELLTGCLLWLVVFLSCSSPQMTIVVESHGRGLQVTWCFVEKFF